MREKGDVTQDFRGKGTKKPAEREKKRPRKPIKRETQSDAKGKRRIG